MKYSKVFGNYYITLGWLSLATLIVGILLAFWMDSLRIDFSFIIWLWLGYELKKGNPTAREWAIVISCFVTIGVFLAFALGGKANFGSIEFKAPDIVFYLIGIGVFLILGLPGLLLLPKKAKEEFNKTPNKTDQDNRKTASQ